LCRCGANDVLDFPELVSDARRLKDEMWERVRERTEQLERTDERLISRFEPPDIAAILRPHGFCDIEDINAQQIASRFGRAVQGFTPGQPGIHVVHARR
jgi:hypothetical protein